MTLDEARIAAARLLPRAFVLTKGETAPNGAAWILLASGGIKAEGQPWPALCPDEETAARLWFDAYEKYCRDRTVDLIRAGAASTAITLYWRQQPEIENFHMTIADWPQQTQRTAGTWCTVRSRLAIVQGDAA